MAVIDLWEGGIINRRLNYDEELRLYEKLRINYSHIISEPRNDTDNILNSIFSRTSLVRLWDKIIIDTEHPFPGDGGITSDEAYKIENGMKFLALYGSNDNSKERKTDLVSVMKKTDPELVEEIIRTTKAILGEIKEKYRFEVVTMHQKAERSVEQDLSAHQYSRNPEEVFSLILSKNAELLGKEDFLEVFRRMKIYRIYSKLSDIAKGISPNEGILEAEVEKLIYALQFLKFLYLVRTEHYGTQEIIKFDKFLKRASDLHPDWLKEIDKDYHAVLKSIYAPEKEKKESKRK